MANEQRRPGNQQGSSAGTVAPLSGSTPTPSQAATPPGMPQDLPNRKGWEEKVQEFLWEKGWRPSGTDHNDQILWDDPKGSNDPPQKKLSHYAKDEQGNQVTVQQTFAPPIPWSHSTVEAYGIQRARDQWEADAPKRKAEADALEQRRQEYQKILAARRARRQGLAV